MVITEPFRATTAAMARMAGLESYPCAVVPHPFSSLTPAQVEARARAIAEEIGRALLQV